MRVFCLAVLSVFLFVALTGCGMSAPYVMKMDRVDQKMDIGNRGYLKGTPPPPKDRGDLKRPFIAVDIDLPEAGGKEEAKVETEEAIAEKKEEVTAMEETTPAMKEAKKEEEIK